MRNRPPPVRQVTAWITGLPGHLNTDDEVRMNAIRARCPEIDAAVRHVAGFARMIKNLSGDEEQLTAWTAAVDHDLPTLRAFTGGLRRDIAAVTAGLTLQDNSGAVEGTVNKIKARKTQLFGRANHEPAQETDTGVLNEPLQQPQTPQVRPIPGAPSSLNSPRRSARHGHRRTPRGRRRRPRTMATGRPVYISASITKPVPEPLNSNRYKLEAGTADRRRPGQRRRTTQGQAPRRADRSPELA